jgi:hypothetical protein
VAGVMTRIEAFKNVIDNAIQKKRVNALGFGEELKLAN